LRAKQASYKRAIIKHLYFNKELSCADLSLFTGKSLPLTTKILYELIEESIVVETGFASSTGGRRPLMYSLKEDQMYILGVSMDQKMTRIVLMDIHNKYISEVKKIELSLINNSKALIQLTDSINNYLISSGVQTSKVVGIGIGMPGFVDVVKGINHSCLITEKDKSIVDVISNAVGIPVWIDNDSTLIALSELRFGAAKGRQNTMVVNVGWGIGLGMILEGKLFRGNNGFAGEFSHMSICESNKMCTCGKSGCLETEASLLVMVEKAIKGIQQGEQTILKNISIEHLEHSSEAIMEAAVKGDKFSVELISEAGYFIGRGVAILIHLLNPELIILSGRGSAAGKLWLTPIQQAINEYCIPKLAQDTDIEISTLGYQAELIGAAALVMEHLDEMIIIKNKIKERA